jgi:hypothetical protein
MVAPLMAVLLTVPGTAPADRAAQAEATFAQGVQLASNNPGEARMCFTCAAAMYEQLCAATPSPALYRNLGNAYLLALDPDDAKADNLARAILAYRRGLQLDPADHELRRRLEYARQQVYHAPPGTFGQPPTDHRPPWLPRWPGLLFTLAAAGYALAWLAFVRWRMVRRRLWLNVAGAWAVFMLLFLAGWAAEARQISLERRYPPVVIARDGVQLLVGNGSRYPPRYETPLHRGVEAQLRHDRGRWLQIELGGGQVGWVPRDAVLLDEL